jgi:hypothetical protein
MLGIAYNSLANAVSRGVLTPLPRKGQRRGVGRLVRQQVELFITPPDSEEKKRLSLSDLSHDEAVLWHQIKRSIEGGIPQKNITPSENPPLEIVLDAIERVASLGMDVIEELAVSFDESFNPEKIIDAICDSPSFAKIMELLGVEQGKFTGFSAEEKTRIQESAEKLAYQIAFKFQQIQLRKMAMELERERERQTA